MESVEHAIEALAWRTWRVLGYGHCRADVMCKHFTSVGKGYDTNRMRPCRIVNMYVVIV